jgi:hypothetical protein
MANATAKRPFIKIIRHVCRARRPSRIASNVSTEKNAQVARQAVFYRIRLAYHVQNILKIALSAVPRLR